MKKLTTMKNKNVKYRNPVIALLIITLFIAGCFEIRLCEPALHCKSKQLFFGRNICFNIWR